jgi:hypothetical protein
LGYDEIPRFPNLPDMQKSLKLGCLLYLQQF